MGADLQENGYHVININAWESDFGEEPIIPIICALFPKITSNKEQKESLDAVLKKVVGLNNIAVKAILKVDVNEITKVIMPDNLEENGNKICEKYKIKVDTYKELRKELGIYIKNLEKKPLIIMVDELDRVRPDYAVKFLEAIKHIFSVAGICFILAVDREQLNKSVQQLYGAIDFNNYYRRFITNEINLPQAVKNGDITLFTQKLFDRYFTEKQAEDIKFCVELNQIKQNTEEISRIFSLTPRNIQHYYRDCSQFLALERDAVMYPDWGRAACLLIAFRNYQPELYNKIGKQSSVLKDIVSFLDNEASFRNKNKKKEEYRLNVILITINSYQDIQKQLENIVDEETVETVKSIISQQNRIFRINQSILSDLYTKLESWKEFI